MLTQGSWWREKFITCIRTAFSKLSTLTPFFFSNSCRSGARASALQKQRNVKCRQNRSTDESVRPNEWRPGCFQAMIEIPVLFIYLSSPLCQDICCCIAITAQFDPSLSVNLRRFQDQSKFSRQIRHAQSSCLSTTLCKASHHLPCFTSVKNASNQKLNADRDTSMTTFVKILGRIQTWFGYCILGGRQDLMTQ